MANQGTVVYFSNTMVIRYKPDRNSIARCAVGNELKAEVRYIAKQVAQPYAESISPVRSDTDRRFRRRSDGSRGAEIPPGEYKRSFRTRVEYVVIVGHHEGQSYPMRRVACRLYNFSDHSTEVEWGTRRGGRAYHVLGRTLSHLSSGLTGRI